MKEISMPRKMLEHVKEHGDPETIIPHMVQVHLEAMKQYVKTEEKQTEKSLKNAILTIAYFSLV
jgi:hypothetical protein